MHEVSSYDGRLVPVLTAKMLDMGMPKNIKLNGQAIERSIARYREHKAVWTVGNTTHKPTAVEY